MVQRDTYNKTGCFDLLCSGFVHTNKNIVLGGTLGPISSPGGQQYELNYAIYSVIITSMRVLVCVFLLIGAISIDITWVNLSALFRIIMESGGLN